VLGALAFTSLFAVTGCARGCTSSRPPIHLNPSMDAQPKVRTQTANTFFYNGASMREPVPGTVPIGGLKEDTAFFTGKGADEQFVATSPVTVDEALVERGRQRYGMYIIHFGFRVVGPQAEPKTTPRARGAATHRDENV
jgi:hypothetical protein